MLQRTSSAQGSKSPERSEGGERLPVIRRSHQLTLKNREQMTVEGVVEVESFDKREVILETVQGGMVIRGEDLNIRELNVEGSGLVLSGFVHAIEYTGESLAKQSRGFLGRLFR